MMRRVAAALLLLAACRGPGHETFRGAPVILISVDTLRSDHLPVYGYRAIQTPKLDAFRRDAMLFQRAYSHCPLTLPSHLSILTGLLPTEHGVRNNIGYHFDGTKFRTLAKVLSANGYQTGAAVSAYVLRRETGVNAGFDDFDDSVAGGTGALSEYRRSGFETLRYAKAWIGQHASRPFFFFFHIYEPHAPYDPSYDGEIVKSDAIVGGLLQHLRSLGLYDRALIVFLSDHGEGLWQHGEDQHGILLYREALQVPLMIKLPRSKHGGSTISEPAQLVDVFPTVLSLLGIEHSERSLFGQSRPVYSETLYPRIHLGWSELRSLIDQQYHYIDGPRPELYDLSSDPGETVDRVSVERRVSAAFRRQLQTFPSAMTTLGAIRLEEAAKLAALGYVGSPKNRAGPLPNPRDLIGDLQPIKGAFRLADERHNDEAVVAFRKLLERNSYLTDVWSRLGEVLVDSGRFEEAIATYKTAMAASEHFSPELALGLGLAYLSVDRPHEATAYAQLAVAVLPRESHELMARAYAAERQFRLADEYARRAIVEGNRQPSSILLLAEMQRDEGEVPLALETIGEAERRANELEMQHLCGLDDLRGDVFARLDRPDEAVAAYQREIQYCPQDLRAYAHLAVIYRIEGKNGDAEKMLRLMTRNNPHRGAYALAAKTRAALAGKGAG